MQTKIINSMNMKRENRTQVMPFNNEESITVHDSLSSNESSKHFCMIFIDCSSETNRRVASVLILLCIFVFICYYQCYECRQVNDDIRCLTSSNISRYSQKRHLEHHVNNLS